MSRIAKGPTGGTPRRLRHPEANTPLPECTHTGLRSREKDDETTKGSAMRLSKSKRGSLAISAAVLASCAVFIGVTPAAASTPDAGKAKHDKKCIELHFIEKLAAAYPGTPVTGVGALGNFFDKLYALDGATQVGTGVGTYNLLYQRPSDGHIIEYATEQDQLPGGTVAITGYFDRTALFAFQRVTLQAKGTSGEYLGYSGTESSVMISLTEPGFPETADFVLCRPGA
jgi:hypothetical protein